MSEKNEPSYWFNVMNSVKNERNVVIRLSDEQTLEEALSRGGDIEGIDHIVKSVRHFKEGTGLAQYLLFEIVDEGAEDPDDLYLCVKIVDDEVDIRIYFIDDEFPPFLRSRLVDDDVVWLFDSDDIDDYIHEINRDICDISYTAEFDQELDKKKTISFDLKDQGELHGTSTVIPKESGIDDDEFTTIVEYSTYENIDNPELLVLEVGNDEDHGGLITVLPGSTINESEVDVLIS